MKKQTELDVLRKRYLEENDPVKKNLLKNKGVILRDWNTLSKEEITARVQEHFTLYRKTPIEAAAEIFKNG